MTKSQFATPILFIIYNRPQYTKRVFEEIKKLQPKYLYVAADGPQTNNSEDVSLCRESRKIIDGVDWSCSVKTLLRDKNLGCKDGVSGAIDWFFGQVEEGVILEDDCLPSQSFFSFCQLLLERYRFEPKVMMIAGTNFVPNMVIPESYFFSEYFPIWGWATWRRAWKLYDVTMKQSTPQKDIEMLKRAYDFEPRMIRNTENSFSLIRQNKLDTWDVQWAYTCLKCAGVSIIPQPNLISNIGLKGVHSKVKDSSHELPKGIFKMDQVVHPSDVLVKKEYNRLLYKKVSPARWKVFGSLLIQKVKQLYS